jgi:hypothetical protein
MSSGIQRVPDPRGLEHDSHNLSQEWRFAHPPRGTCIPGCPQFGTCHCGCGARPKLSQTTFEPTGRVKGRPFIFVPGHQLRVLHPRVGIWAKNGVPVEDIRPFVLWLRERHGTIRAVAVLLEIPESTLRGYVYNTKRKRVPPQTASRIVTLVLAHRKRTGALDMWEEQPGLRRAAPAEQRGGRLSLRP